MQCPFSIRHEVFPDVNSQLRGFDDDVDVFSQVICPVHGFSQNGMVLREWICDFGKPIRFIPKSVSAYHYHSGKSGMFNALVWSFDFD
jgi:hypothetical protein